MPVSSHPDRERAPIVFGHKTALAILRSAAPRTLPPVAGKARVLPSRAPARGEVEAAIEHLKASYPDLRLERPAHVLVGSAALGRPSKAVKSHSLTVPLSGTSFYRLGDGVFACVPALAFVQEAARGKSLVAMLELGYELCGTYRTRRTGAAAAYGVEPLASVRSLGGYAARNASVDGARKVGRALRYLADGSASARETKQALVLGLPHRHGGYGLGIPHMNYEVGASRAAESLTGKKSFRMDLCWPERKLDVEYQSREWHEGEASRVSDSRRANALMSMGWTVVGGDERRARQLRGDRGDSANAPPAPGQARADTYVQLPWAQAGAAQTPGPSDGIRVAEGGVAATPPGAPPAPLHPVAVAPPGAPLHPLSVAPPPLPAWPGAGEGRAGDASLFERHDAPLAQ